MRDPFGNLPAEMRPFHGVSPTLVKTYELRAPSDRTVRYACEQVGCAAWRNGWQSVIDENTDLGAKQAAYIRHRSGRTFRETRTAGLTVFRFDSYQRCFEEHRTRPEFYLVRGGDSWRRIDEWGHRHVRAEDWVDDCANHQIKVAERLTRG